MIKPLVSFEEFELPFAKSKQADEVWEERESQLEGKLEPQDEDEDEDSTDALERMEALIPDGAIFLGVVEDEVDNWRSWKVEEHFYIIQLQNSEYEWALFRISWDDNWGRFEWSLDMRASGFENHSEAANFMVIKLFERWEIDLANRENAPYAAFLGDLCSTASQVPT